MLDDDTKRGRIIRAALKLAAETGWRRLGLHDVAREADVTLADIRGRFESKTAILEAFTEEVDREVLKTAEPDPDQPARDRIFDVVMTRFDVLAPYKEALRRIAHDTRAAPGAAAQLARASLRSQSWMLAAAGIEATGPLARARAPGLLCVYARVMGVWLDDDDPGHGRTMAALDRELRSGERWLRRLDTVCSDLGRLACSLLPRRRRYEPDVAMPPAETDLGPGAEQPGVG